MLTQYLEIKKQHPDAILFYQMGDFFEMFFEDALLAAPLLEVQLTSRDKNAENPIPMCGIPIHALSTYLPRLLAHGKRVAVCQQVESPEVAKGIVKREVTRVFTPALVADPELVVVLVPHAAIEHVGHRLEAAMRMRGEAGDVVAGLVGAELVEHQEGIEVGQLVGADHARQANTGAIGCRHAAYATCDRAKDGFRGCGLRGHGDDSRWGWPESMGTKATSEPG